MISPAGNKTGIRLKLLLWRNVYKDGISIIIKQALSWQIFLRVDHERQDFMGILRGVAGAGGGMVLVVGL